jgi:hypothetical protein
VGAVVASESKCPIDAKKRCRLFSSPGLLDTFQQSAAGVDTSSRRTAAKMPFAGSFDRSNYASNRRGASMTGMALGLESEVVDS